MKRIYKQQLAIGFRMLSLIGFLFLPAFAFGETKSDTTKPAKPEANPLSFSGYVETYFSYDFGNPSDHNRPGFVYSHNRHNEVNLNLGFVKAAYSTDRVRGNLALMAGTYANANLASEPGVLQNVFEANAGFRLSKTKNLWIDAGILPSHIGFESAVGKDCWNLTRSLLADNSPYFESGARISYTSQNEKWYLSALLLNGWQRIQRPEGNQTPSFGHQLTWKPNTKLTVNSSSFIGNDKPDSVRQMRYFHNLYAVYQPTDALGVTLGFDFGAEQKSKNSGDYNTWYTPVLIIKYAMNDAMSLAVRGEYYQDKTGVIIATGTENGFQTWGYSLNLDYKVADNVLWRIEGRGLSSRDPIFMRNQKATTSNLFGTTSLALSF
ncbi:MAG TPA: porin [Catalimonadaceae bacterium]|nr:porin [Catalimonadaceae bacterium]